MLCHVLNDLAYQDLTRSSHYFRLEGGLVFLSIESGQSWKLQDTLPSYICKRVLSIESRINRSRYSEQKVYRK